MSRSQATADSVRIAQISDLHMIDPRASLDWRARILSIGRKLDAQCRIDKLSAALAASIRAGADHLVVSGDLTETGAIGEFETVADVLDRHWPDPDRVTLVPGNHDVYASPDAWMKAMEGPLRRYRRNCADRSGKVVEVGPASILPVDATCHQSLSRSSGLLLAGTADAVESRLADRQFRARPVLLVQHHPPYAHRFRLWQWIDGLVGWHRIATLVHRFSNLSVLHGHAHRMVDLVAGGATRRIFGAPATVEDHKAQPRVRIFQAGPAGLFDLGLAA